MSEKFTTLKKLIKYEIKKTWKIITLICSVIICTGIFLGIVGESSNNSTLNTIAFLIFMLQASAFMLTFVYLPVRYYKSLYSAEGYLAFTLPASIKQVISSKMLTGAIWTFTVFVSIIIGVCLHNESSRNVFLSEDIGGSIVAFIILSLIAVSNIFISYFSVTIGCLWKKHKLIGTIICYVFTCFVVCALASLLYRGLAAIMYNTNNDVVVSEIQAWSIFAAEAISAVILCFLLNHTSAVITEKTLNLE